LELFLAITKSQLSLFKLFTTEDVDYLIFKSM
jgi:hypothetical protein